MSPQGNAMNDAAASAYVLHFRSIFDAGRGFAFPCAADGQVDMDSLSDRALNNYLYARTVIGREFLSPVVEQLHQVLH